MRSGYRTGTAALAGMALVLVGGCGGSAAPAALAPVPPAPAEPASIAPTSAASAALHHLTLAVSSTSASNLVQYVGMDYGIYAKYGLAIELQQLKSNITPAALVSQQVDYSTGLDSALRVAATGMPIKAVAVSKRAPTFGLVARPEIESIAGLRDKVVGTATTGGSNYYTLKRLLEANQMALQDVQVLAVGDAPVQLQNLLQGTIDATPLSAPAIFKALDQGYRMLVYAPDQVAFGSTGLVASDEAIRTRRDEIKRLIAAQVESIEFIQQHKAAAVDLLVRRFDISPALAAQTYDFEVPAYTTDPRLDRRDIEATIHEEIEAGHLAAPVRSEQLVALDLTEEALAATR